MSEHSEEENAPKEFKKRIVKSKAQVEALEQFYVEHKYLTESMKEELAKSTGLTEKQISGWFCHRRLKDKKLTNPEAKATGRPERSNGAAYDPGSGLRQDSCGSTKQEEERTSDLREVESERLNHHESSAADINYELGSRHVATAKHSSREDTSSGSGSSLRNVSLSHGRNHFTVDASRNQTHKLPLGKTEFKPRPGPSGYLKVKGQVENAAITAVKKNLGRHYRTDGPPLGVDFDTLPPGAFGSHIVEPPNESYYAEEPALNHSPEISLGQRRHNSGPGYWFDSGISSHNSARDDSRFKRARGSDHHESYYRDNFNTKSPKYSQYDTYPARGSSTDIHEGSVRRARGYESWDVDQKASRDIGKSFGPVSGHNQSHLFTAKASRKQPKPWLQNQNTMRSRVSASDHYDSSRLNLTSKRVIYDESKTKGLSRRLPKVTKRPADKVAVNEDFDRVRPEFLSKNDMTAAKRVKGEHLEDYGTKKPFRNETGWASRVPRPAAEVPSSFNKEEDDGGDGDSDDDDVDADDDAEEKMEAVEEEEEEREQEEELAEEEDDDETSSDN